MVDVKEKQFEDDIAEYLITKGGYKKGDPSAFDCKLALDTGTFIDFIKSSQPNKLERYTKIYGSDSERQIIERFCREAKQFGYSMSCVKASRIGQSHLM